MLSYKLKPIRKKRTFTETNVYTNYGVVKANILINERTENWVPGVEKEELGYFETRQYGPAKVIVFRMPFVENPKAAAESRTNAWTKFYESAIHGSFDRESYIDMCENGFPANISEKDIERVFSLLGIDRKQFDYERERKALVEMNRVMFDSDINGYVSPETRQNLVNVLKETGCFYKHADCLRNFYENLKEDWVHVSIPEFPDKKYLVWNNVIYEIKSFYKRSHGQTCACDKKYEEDVSWSVSLGLKKFDWTGADVCWRLSCRNILDSDEGRNLLLKSFGIKDDRSAYFNACNALKDVKEELLNSEYGEVSEFYGDDADIKYDSLLQDSTIILNCVRRLVVQKNNGDLIFAEYVPNCQLTCKTVRKNEINDNVKTLISALNIHKRTIENTRERLSKSDIYLAVKKKGFCS